MATPETVFLLNPATRVWSYARLEALLIDGPQSLAHRYHAISPAFMAYVYEHWLNGHNTDRTRRVHKGYSPTSGTLGIVVALYLCSSVSVFGFGHDLEKPVWYYDKKKTPGYEQTSKDFNDRRDASTDFHDFPFERWLMASLGDAGLLTVYA